EDNIARWSGQVRDAAGNAVAPVSEKRTVNGFNITTVAMEGSFVGMGDSAPRSDWRLQGAIVEAPGGLLFIKMTGPVEPMKAASTDFLRMLDSISPH
ncbi:MAG: hypothetical protein JNK58_12045, partial [Phycisphaerae bacterium]|nr:hypothetical protein [Phycisphaerae bacterium]